MPSASERQSPIDVLCVGYACVDLNFKVSHHPTADEKMRASSMRTCGGGPAANAAVTVARLGGRASFSGHLGNDAFGSVHLAELKQEGVHVEGVFRSDELTPVAAVSIKPDGARSIIDFRSPNAAVPIDQISLREIGPKVLLLDGHQPLLSDQLVNEARELGIPTLLDAGSVHDGTLMLYNRVDYLVTSEKFARAFSSEEDPRLALAAMDGAAPFVAVTWGSDGVYWQDENGQHHTPAFDIEPEDTTGAGDAFHGAFAIGLALGVKPRDNIRMASAAGALTCLKVGARNALPSKSEVERLSGIQLSDTKR